MRIVVILLMSSGIILSYLLLNIMDICRVCTYDEHFQYNFCEWDNNCLLIMGFGIILTLVTFDLYPFLHIRKKNKERKEIILK